MNAISPLSPRIAMFNASVALLPQYVTRPLGKLEKTEQSAVFHQAVSAARELLKLCDYGGDALTTADLKSAVVAATEPVSATTKPEWIRLPEKGRCPYTGLSRSVLYNLVAPCAENGHKPPVRSVSLRRKGCVRGVRLIDYRSLLAFLDSQSDTGIR